MHGLDFDDDDDDLVVNDADRHGVIPGMINATRWTLRAQGFPDETHGKIVWLARQIRCCLSPVWGAEEEPWVWDVTGGADPSIEVGWEQCGSCGGYVAPPAVVLRNPDDAALMEAARGLRDSALAEQVASGRQLIAVARARADKGRYARARYAGATHTECMEVIEAGFDLMDYADARKRFRRRKNPHGAAMEKLALAWAEEHAE